MTLFKKENTHSLSDIIKGIQHAADSTKELMLQSHIQLMDKFFYKNKNGNFHAKSVTIELDDNKSLIKVPLISLISPSSMYLEKLEIDMNIEADGKLVNNCAREVQGHDTSRTKFDVSISSKKSSNAINLKMSFCSKETPEALKKVIDKFTEKIFPVQVKE